MPANERRSASLNIVHRPNQNPKEVFIDGWLDFERDTIDTELHIRAICAIRAIRTNRTIENSLIRLIVLRKSGFSHRKRSCDRERNDIWKHLVDNFFFQLMLPVIVLVDGDMVLITPLADCEPAGSLIREPDGPFSQVCLVKFLLCIHEMILP